MNQLDKYKIDLTKDEYAIILPRSLYLRLTRLDQKGQGLTSVELREVLLDLPLITIPEIPKRIKDGNL